MNFFKFWETITHEKQEEIPVNTELNDDLTRDQFRNLSIEQCVEMGLFCAKDVLHLVSPEKRGIAKECITILENYLKNKSKPHWETVIKYANDIERRDPWWNNAGESIGWSMRILISTKENANFDAYMSARHAIRAFIYGETSNEFINPEVFDDYDNYRNIHNQTMTRYQNYLNIVKSRKIPDSSTDADKNHPFHHMLANHLPIAQDYATDHVHDHELLEPNNLHDRKTDFGSEFHNNKPGKFKLNLPPNIPFKITGNNLGEILNLINNSPNMPFKKEIQSYISNIYK